MISLLFSDIMTGVGKHREEIVGYVKDIKNIVVFPWTFPSESDTAGVIADCMTAGGRRYDKVLAKLNQLGVEYNEITFVNPYNTNRQEVERLLELSDGIFLPGGNPEMFLMMALRLQVADLFSDYKKLVIGESAGSILQFELYPISSADNYYEVPSIYNGFGLIKAKISINVHTSNVETLDEMRRLAKLKNMQIYALTDESVMIYNRQNDTFKVLGEHHIVG